MKRITLKQALREFPTYLNIRGLTKSTSEAYQGDMKIFEKYMDASYPSIVYADTVRSFHIISYRNFLVEKIETKEYKRSTVDRKYDSLKVFFDFLEELKSIEENFVKKFTFHRFRNITFTEAKEILIPRFLSQDEIKKIIGCAKEDRTKNKLRDIAILEILRNTGCRRSSIFDLEWKDIDFQEKEIIIKHRKSKNWSNIPLNRVLEQALIDYKHSLNEYTQNVFQIKKDAFTNIINKYVKQSDLQEKKDFKITAHIFRHSFITYLVKKDVPLEKIAKFTGHKDIRSLQIYIHLVPSDLEDITDFFD